MSKLYKYLIATDNDVASLILRVSLGVVMFPHGAQKLFGWFGGYGFAGTMGWMTESMGIPAPLAFLAIMAESFGALFLIAGVLTRVAAFGIGGVMVVAALTAHLEYGFFMNWSGQQAGEGIEYHILAAAMALALVIKGAGRASVDRILQDKWTTASA